LYSARATERLLKSPESTLPLLDEVTGVVRSVVC
jgi:hypothetical protein